MSLNKLGNRIQTAREEKKMSQEQLAHAIGCSQSALSNYEKGKRRIYLSQLEKLSEVLDKPIDYFMEVLESDNLELPSSNMQNNLILIIMNSLYRLDQENLSEVYDYIKYLMWRRKERRG